MRRGCRFRVRIVRSARLNQLSVLVKHPNRRVRPSNTVHLVEPLRVSLPQPASFHGFSATIGTTLGAAYCVSPLPEPLFSRQYIFRGTVPAGSGPTNQFIRYSTISSARESSACGRVKPSACPVLRIMLNGRINCSPAGIASRRCCSPQNGASLLPIESRAGPLRGANLN